MYKVYVLISIIFIIININSVSNDALDFGKHRPIELSDDQFTLLNSLGNDGHFRRTLKEICIPRVVGTEGHKRVRDFIIQSMQDLEWQIDTDIFDQHTPIFGTLKFENIIATQNPRAKRFLTLACHYDSKYFKDFEFLGATDSAVPCAMLINLAKTLKVHLQNNNDINNDISLMFIFFDGEEAFLEWGPKDAIYGAKHLAEKWKNSGFLNKIDMLVLLDLIGTPDPKFHSFYPLTEVWYRTLIDAESRLTNLGYLTKHVSSGFTKNNFAQYFTPYSANSFIEDDHIPFLKNNVPILHLIPIPFSDVWHKREDNLSIVDYVLVDNLNTIFRAFVANYLKFDL